MANLDLQTLDVASVAWAQFWQVTVTVVLVAVLARCCCRRRPHLAYLLWMLVIIKALTPPLVASRAGMFSWLLRTETPQAIAAEPAPIEFQPPPPAATIPRYVPLRPLALDEPAEPDPAPIRPPEPQPGWPAWLTGQLALFSLWLCGVLALATYVAAKWIACRRLWRRGSVPVPASIDRLVCELAKRLQLRLGVRRRLRVLATHGAGSPAVFGVWRPTLLLPADLLVGYEARRDAAKEPFSIAEGGHVEGPREGNAPAPQSCLDERASEVARRRAVDESVDTHQAGGTPALDAILAHELIHVRRGDPAATLLQLLAQLLWWFHPLIWWANREARRERERACDEEVVTGLGCRPADYARALLDVLERQSRPQPAFAVPGVGMLGVTARRMEHLLRRADGFHRRTPWSYYLAVLVILALVLPGAGLKLAAAPEEGPDRSTVGGTAKSGVQHEPGSIAAVEETKALARLRELGASANDHINSLTGQRDLSVGVDERFQGTVDDLKLLADVPGLTSLHWGFPNPLPPAALADLNLAAPVKFLTLQSATDNDLEKLPKLPKCNSLILSGSLLGDDGTKRLVELARDVESLMVASDDGRGTSDAGLAHIATLEQLKRLDLVGATVSDAGLKSIASLGNLEELLLNDCLNVTGSGLNAAAGLGRLRSLTLHGGGVEADVFRAIASLPQLERLNIEFGKDKKIRPADVVPLATLKALKYLSASRNVAVPDNQPVLNAVEDVALGNAILAQAGRLPNLQSLHLFAIVTSDAGLAALVPQPGAGLAVTRPVPSLRYLSLLPVTVTDTGLAALGHLGALRQISLGGEARITEAGFAKLADLKRLTFLTLPATDVTDGMLARLAPLASLKGLTLSGAKRFTGSGLAALKDHWRLRGLSLIGSSFDDEGTRSLAAFPLLEVLELSQTKITDRSLATIGKLTGLRTLALGETAITDAGLAELAGLKRLDESGLALNGTKVTDAGRARLEAATPGLRLPRANARPGWTLSSMSRMWLMAAAEQRADTTDDDEKAKSGAQKSGAAQIGAGAPSPRPAPSGGATARADSDDTPPPKPAHPTIIVTANVILWDNRIVSWDQMVLRLRTMRADGPIHPHFRFTNGAYANGAEKSFHKRLFDIYKELFQPAGMSLGSMTPRAGAWLDRIHTEDDLRPDPALARHGRVLIPGEEEKPAAGAQVIIVPAKETLDVALVGKALRDASDEQVVLTDDDGRYTIYPDSDEFVLAILHDSGCDVRPVPAPDERPTIELAPWASVTFTATGGVKEQTGDISVRPAGVEPGQVQFYVYQTRVEDEPVEVPVPAGKITVSRSLKMDDSSSISMPVEQFELAAGENREAALAPPTDADRAKAEEFHRPLREARAAAQVARKDEAQADEAKPASGAEKGQGGAAAQDTPTGTPARDGQGADEALARMRELGASAFRMPVQGRTLSVSIQEQGWQGTDADLGLLARLPDLGALSIDLRTVGGAALAELRFDPPLTNLTLEAATDETLARLTRLPDTRSLRLQGCSLSAAGCDRLAELAGQIEMLVLHGTYDPRKPEVAPRGIEDDGLKAIGRMRNLQSLTLAALPITDAGVAHLDRLESLRDLQLMVCLSVKGPGYARLAPLDGLKSISLGLMPLTREAVAALAQLKQLERLALQLDELPAGIRAPELQPADVEVLKNLVSLQHLQFTDTRERKNRTPDVALGDAILKAAGKLPNLRYVSFYGVGSGDAGAAGLASAEKLEGLSLQPVELSDRVLADFARMSKLRSLSLGGKGRVSGNGLAALASLTELTELGLDGGGIADDDLARLPPLPKLDHLSLAGSKITGPGLEALRRSPQLKMLELAGSPLDDAGSRFLADVTNVERLVLRRTRITDQALANVAKLSQLRDLDVSNTAITDAGLARLRSLKHLTEINLAGTKTTEAGRAKFLADMPAMRDRMSIYSLQATPLDEVAADAGYQDSQAADDSPADAKSNSISSRGHGEGQPAIDSTSSQPAAEGGVADAPAPGEGTAKPAQRQFKPTGTYVPAGAVLTKDPDPQEAIRFTRGDPAAVRRLRDLGALVEPAPYEGSPPGEAWNVSIQQNWKGTDADLKLISDVPDVAFLYFDLSATSGAGIGSIKLAAPAELLTMSSVTDEAVAKITGLPAAKRVTLAGGPLSAAGCQRVAQLAAGVEHLTLQGIPDFKNPQVPPRGIDDAGLAHIGQIKSLKYLELALQGITDAGLAGLAGLDRLEEFRLVFSPGVHGSGYAALAPLGKLKHFSAYMMPLTADGLKGLSQLGRLEDIHFQLDKDSAAGLAPEDFAPLAKLSSLRQLSFVDPQNPWAVTGNTPQPPEALLRLRLGDAILRALAKLPELRLLQLDGIGAGDAGVAALAESRELTSLLLRPMVYDDASFAALGRLTSLTRLGISGLGRISPASLARLAPLVKLKYLSIHRGELTDEALKSLAPLSALESLDLPDSKIIGPGLSALAPLKNLKSLSLVRAPMTDAGCQPLAAFASLEDLNLSETKITDQALASLVKLANLRSLTLSNTAVTSAGLAALAELKNLKSLKVEGLEANRDDLAALRRRLPHVTVDVRGVGWTMMPAAPKKAGEAGQGARAIAPNTFKAAGAAKLVEAAEPAQKPAKSRSEAGPRADGVYVFSENEPADQAPADQTEDAQKSAPPADAKPPREGAAKPDKPKTAHYIYAAPPDVAERSREAAGSHAITITGQASDNGGKPVAGATIRLVALGLRKPQEIGRATTDAQGRYEFRDARLPLAWSEHPRGAYQIYGTAAGHGIAWQGTRHFHPKNRPAGEKETSRGTPDVYADDTLVVDLKFGAEATLRGRLVDKADKPIVGAKVSLFQARRLGSGGKPASSADRYLLALVGDSPAATTGADGRFTLSGLAKEMSASIRIVHPEFGERGYEVGLTDTPAAKNEEGRAVLVGDVDLRFDRTRKVRLQVIYDATAAPVSGASVSAWGHEDGNVFASGKTGEQGAAQLSLPPGKYELTIKPDRATAPAGYLETMLPLVVDDAPQEQIKTVRLPAGCSLEIEVIDADTGKAIPDVSIAKSPEADGDGLRQLHVIGSTDEQGMFRQLVAAGKQRYGPVPPRFYSVVDGSDKLVELSGGKTVKLNFKLRKETAEAEKKAPDSEAKPASEAQGSAPATRQSRPTTGETAANPLDRQEKSAPADGNPPRVKLTFTPLEPAAGSDAPGAQPSPRSTAGQDGAPPDGPAARRLRELGANVYVAGQPRPASVGIGIDRGQWKGTDADLALVGEVPDLEYLTLDLAAVKPAALEGLKLPGRLDTLILWPVTDDTAQQIPRLPTARQVTLNEGALSAAGCRRLAQLIAGVEKLQIVGPHDPRRAKIAPKAVPDAGVEALAQLDSLKALDLVNAAVTDHGLARLTRLGKLESLWFSNCPGVHGSGLAALKALPALRKLEIIETSLDADGLKSLAELVQLRALSIYPARFKPGDVAVLKKLVNLRTLTVTGDEPQGPRGETGSVTGEIGRFQLEFHVDPPLEHLGRGGAAGDLLIKPPGGKDSSADAREAEAAADQLSRFAGGGAEAAVLGVRINPLPERSRQQRAQKAAVGDALLAAAAAMPALEGLMLWGINSSDAGLAAFHPAAKLKTLHLGPVNVSDGGLASIARLAALEKLTLDGQGGFTVAGLASLTALRQLRELSLPAGLLTDDMLPGLARLPALESLALPNGKLTGRGLLALRTLPKLKKLAMPGSLVNDEGCQSLPALAALESLDLDSTQITDRALDPIGKLSNLQDLSLSFTGVTGTELAKLDGLKRLVLVNLRGSKIASEQRARFTAMHPNVHIEDGGGAWLTLGPALDEPHPADAVGTYKPDGADVSIAPSNVDKTSADKAAANPQPNP